MILLISVWQLLGTMCPRLAVEMHFVQMGIILLKYSLEMRSVDQLFIEDPVTLRVSSHTCMINDYVVQFYTSFKGGLLYQGHVSIYKIWFLNSSNFVIEP